MSRAWRNAPILTAITVAMIFYSLLLVWSAWKLGIANGTGVVPYTPLGQTEVLNLKVLGYFDKWNWLLFPAYWPISAVLIYFSWELFLNAWRSLAENRVLYRANKPLRDGSILEPFLSRLSIFRVYLIALSVIVGLVLTTIDATCLLHEYSILAPSHSCPPDFTVAFRLRENFPHFHESDQSLLKFILAQYLMQGILIAMAFTVLSQLLLHSFAFLKFESLRYPKQHGLSLRLNVADEFGEFGLSDINKAINLTYIFIAFAMIVPVLSVASKPPGADAGQILMAILLPLLLFAPAIIPIFDRIMRRNAAERAVRTQGDRDLVQSFLRQKLWPFEQTAFSYIGKICLGLAIGAWTYVTPNVLKSLVGILK